MRPDAPSRREFTGRPAAAAAVVCAAIVCAALGTGLLVARSWTIDYPYSIDFQAYWLAGSRVNAGDAAHLYAAGGGPEAGTPQEMVPFEFKNLPIVSLAFAPLARLPYLAAKRVFWWIGLASILASGLVLGLCVVPARFGGPLVRVGFAVGFLGAFAPAATALRHAQTTPLVALAVTLAAAAALAGRPVVSGALLGLGSLVKLPVLALAGLDALRGRARAVGAFAAVLAVAVAASFALFGAPLQRQYVEGLAMHAGTVMPGHNNQSLAALAARLFGPAPVYDWTPRPIGAGAGLLALALTAGLGILVGAGLLAARRAARESGDGDGASVLMLEVPAALAFGIVALPVAWDHYFLLLAPALVMLAVGLDTRGLLARPLVAAPFGLAVFALALPTPQWLLDHADSIGWPARLALSHYLLGALLVIGLAVRGLCAGRAAVTMEAGAAPGATASVPSADHRVRTSFLSVRLQGVRS